MKITEVEFVKSVANLEQLPKDNLSEIAFAGRSNVGKSSLINCLLNRRKLAKTSSTPGKTRHLNYFRINARYYFVDLPGYGFAKVSKTERLAWQRLIEGFITRSENLRGVVSIIDCKVGATELDRQLLAWLVELKTPVLVVATKADKLSKSAAISQRSKIEQEMKRYGNIGVIAFSAKNGTGKKALLSEIFTLLE